MCLFGLQELWGSGLECHRARVLSLAGEIHLPFNIRVVADLTVNSSQVLNLRVSLPEGETHSTLWVPIPKSPKHLDLD